MDILDQINNNAHPNELARFHVTIRDMDIQNISCTEEGVQENMARNRKSNRSSNKESQKKDPDIDLIWKNLGLGKIDMSYACIGYTDDGRPVLSRDDMTNLLMAYGFNIGPILDFIDDFAKCSYNDPKAPIVIYPRNMANIMRDIEPIVGNEDERR